MENRPYACDYDGCEKAFARKEHLARHSKSHDPSNTWLQCPVCKRCFNRNDSLQRHLIKHGEVFQQTPSGRRSKRACLACRAAKTKCDGEHQCSKCAKKGIECRYDGEESHDVDSHMRDDGDDASKTSSGDLQSEPRRARDRALDDDTSLKLTPTIGLLDWTTFRIRPDPQEIPKEPGIDIESQKYLDAYWTRFHHRWPIVHRPSFDEEVRRTDICEVSMRMIGAFILGSTESTKFAIETHSTLMNHLAPRLCNITSRDKYQQSLPSSTCEAALLNIIFGLYYGHDREVSRAMTLSNILTTALRDVGFFKPDTAWADEKKGYFVPLRATRAGQRQRMAYTLFKISAYISLIRDQPMTLLSEELHYHPPTTFAIWDADGLHIWDERQLIEPTHRLTRSMHRTIIDNASATGSSHLGSPMLIEDINLCFYATQSDIWKLNNSGEHDIVQRDTLRKRLELLHSRLELIIARPTSLSDSKFGDEEYLPYRYYFGYEDHSEPGWQEIVTSRVKNMLFDSVMLYYLLSLHLKVDIRTLTLVAKDQNPTPIEELSAAYQRAKEQRQVCMKEWTATPAARKALFQAVEIFTAYGTFKNNLETLGDVRSLDPISHVALCVSALVVWAFCKFYGQDCDICVPSDMQVIELSAWGIRGNQFESEKEEWIEMRGGTYCFRLQLFGVQLCHCNLKLALALFRDCLPDGWDLVESIAPGIF